METVHLPGDREPYELARAIARDKKWNPGEWRAWRAAMMCFDRKENFRVHGLNWRCTHENPCIYCRDLR